MSAIAFNTRTQHVYHGLVTRFATPHHMGAFDCFVVCVSALHCLRACACACVFLRLSDHDSHSFILYPSVSVSVSVSVSLPLSLSLSLSLSVSVSFSLSACEFCCLFVPLHTLFTCPSSLPGAGQAHRATPPIMKFGARNLCKVQQQQQQQRRHQSARGTAGAADAAHSRSDPLEEGTAPISGSPKAAAVAATTPAAWRCALRCCCRLRRRCAKCLHP